MTTLPALSTPCTWNTFLARSTPMALTCMWTTPSGDSFFNDHPLAHSMPGAGVVHHIIRVILTADPSLPVFAGKQTCQALVVTSQRCQLLTLFDHLAGAGEQSWRNWDAHCSRGAHFNSEIEFGRALERQVTCFLTVEHSNELGRPITGSFRKIRPE